MDRKGKKRHRGSVGRPRPLRGGLQTTVISSDLPPSPSSHLHFSGRLLPVMLFRGSTFFHGRLPYRFNFSPIGHLKLRRFTTFLPESPGRPSSSCLLSSLHRRPTGLISNPAPSAHLLRFWLESGSHPVLEVGNKGVLITEDLPPCPAAFGTC